MPQATQDREYRNFKRYCATVRLGMHPWAAEATSILPAGPAACQRLASPVGSRQATGPRRRARPGRVAGDGQPARLGLGTYYKSSCNAGGAAAGSCWALAGSEKRVQKLVGLDYSIGHPSWPAVPMVRVLGHLGWEHPGWPAEQDILSLEARLTDAVRKLPSIVLCAYDVQRLSRRRLLLGGLECHPLTLHRGPLRQNEHHVPAEQFLERLSANA